MNAGLAPVAASDRRISANCAVFDDLVRVAERRTAQGRLESALAWSRLAALFTTCHPTGSLRSVRLERTLDAISRAALEPCGTAVAASARRVLHVLSEAHVIGGHVRMVVRWAAVDDASEHSFVVTRPGCDSPELHESARRAHGVVTVLSGPSLLERARALRRLTARADFVVCHTHCDDPVPAVAFGGDYAGPPVILLNQADHQFFLGTGNVSAVANLRDPLGAEVTVRARGYPASVCFALPVLVPDPSSSTDRAAAKRLLGLDPRRPVAVTIAREEKFRATAVHPGFVEIVEPVLASRPDAQFVAVGPSLVDPVWSAFAARMGGRVHVVGSQAEPERYLDAADLYLDSFPFASTTSLLEAASRDLPLVGIRLYRGLGGLLGGADILESAVITGDSVHTYRARLAEAIDDESLRTRWGRRAGALVRGDHTPDAWRVHLEGLYAHALEAAPCADRRAPVDDGSPELREYAIVLLGVASGDSLSTLLGPVSADFDRHDRAWIGIRRFPTRVAARLGFDPVAGPRVEAALLVAGAQLRRGVASGAPAAAGVSPALPSRA